MSALLARRTFLPIILALGVALLFASTGHGQGAESITAPDTGGDVGRYTSLALDGSGYPVISYTDVDDWDLKVMHCNDANCAGGGESINTLDSATDVGLWTSLALDSAGYPVVSYFAGDITLDLKVMHCNDPNCAGGNESIQSVDSTGSVGRYSSLELDALGYPVISYRDATNGDLKVMHCNDSNCAGGDEDITAVDSMDNVGQCTSLVLDVSGNPVVSYQDLTHKRLRVVRCGNAACSGANTITMHDTATPLDTSLVLDGNQYPVVSYYDVTNKDLKVMHCIDTDCAAPSVGGVAELPDVALGDAQSFDTPREGSGWSAGAYSALAVGLFAAATAIVAGAWYVRRRQAR